MEPYSGLISVFARLGLLAVGGVLSVLPEMQHQSVAVHHWVTAREFTALFALAQSAPGPNMMVVTLLGSQVAGVPGALVASTAFILPPCALVFMIGRVWQRLRGRSWLLPVQAGLSAVTVGLVAAAALLLCEQSGDSIPALAVVAVSALLLMRTRLHPLWVLAGGAALGAAGII